MIVILKEEPEVGSAEIALWISGGCLQSINLSLEEVGEAVEAQRAADGEAVETVKLITSGFTARLQIVFAQYQGPGVTVIEAVGDGSPLVIHACAQRKRAGNRDLVDARNRAGIRAGGADIRQRHNICRGE